MIISTMLLKVKQVFFDFKGAYMDNIVTACSNKTTDKQKDLRGNKGCMLYRFSSPKLLQCQGVQFAHPTCSLDGNIFGVFEVLLNFSWPRPAYSFQMCQVREINQTHKQICTDRQGGESHNKLFSQILPKPRINLFQKKSETCQILDQRSCDLPQTGRPVRRIKI